MIADGIKTMKEVRANHFRYVYEISGRSRIDTAKMLKMSERYVGYWLRELGIIEPREPVNHKNLTAYQRDRFENIDDWG